MSTNNLFSKYQLSPVFENRKQAMIDNINSIAADDLLHTNPDELYDYYEQEYAITPVQLSESETRVDQQESWREVGYDYGSGRTARILGTTFSFFVPFEGDPALFDCRPSRIGINPPQGQVRNRELVITCFRQVSGNQLDREIASVKEEFNNVLTRVRNHLEWIAKDVAAFNASLRPIAKTQLDFRRQKFQNDRSVVESLGFPMKVRENAPQTYIVPTVRRKMPSPVSKTATPLEPEPCLDIQNYEHILSVIGNMVLVMEKSPKAFQTLKEEDFRSHFLVQLNSQYEGQATGETFNFEGKTDILINVRGKNIFVAECKIWRGQETLTEAINQILGYATWRDTKTAILLFNRNKNFSSVLAQIPQVVKTVVR